MINDNPSCPCGSGAAFANCCEPIIKGVRDSQSAEELLRARYSAFATGAIEFIIATTHPRTRREVDSASIREWSETSTWHELQILDANFVSEDKVYVSFEARYAQHGEEVNHRERSLFERDRGAWFFVTGDTLKNPTVRYETPRTGRNEPCPCGSGKKYKKCCAA